MGIFCLFYQNKLAALASQELPEGLASRVERHLHSCPDCLSEWAAQERMATCLRGASLEVQSPAPLLWERLEAAIQAEADEAPVAAPTPRPLRRLAPLGGMALAGAAAAAVFVVRAPHKTPALSPTPPTPVFVAKLSSTPEPLPSPTPKPVTAIQLARQSEKLTPPKTPVAAPDPFRKQRPHVASSPYHVIRPVIARRKRLPEPAERETEISSPTRRHAVAVMEVGMNRITEEAQTAELNRQVTETELREPSALQRAAFAPTDAMSNAQHTRSLFQ
ncbi:zf-HC2 domain-containing protein [Armatimonas sp.]|uniref:anti-sigma factor family protein n=1 Tax=Armatimonas sp. TaxID=1872638 RepID=UPI002869F554|nr:zf-HC2 domain-containing protein [Armatimonas sp.]